MTEASQEFADEPIEGFWGVVPAGGSGTRLWPLSRAGSPKFLYDLTGSGRSLLQGTVDRLRPLCEDRMMVVTGGRHAEAARQQLPELPEDGLVVEPSPRDSMPAIGLAAAILERRDPNAILGSFAADHHIVDGAAFRACVREAVEVARTGKLVTLGIQPTHAATGFGYIHTGDLLGLEQAPHTHTVRGFVEKPDGVTAQQYVSSGEYRWNAGMFVVRASTLLDLLASYQPVMANHLRSIAANPLRLNELWPRLTKIAIDPAVAEPAAVDGKVAMVPADFDWDDVGDYNSLAAVLVPDTETPGVTVLGSKDLVVMQESTGFVAPQSGRTVVTLGLQDIVVVDTDDAVMVTTRDRAQDVKQIVENLKLSGREDLT
ncbi:mannose-1-phosphate guanylyltransferase [Dermacoccaceae bacterium W4C1]